MKKNLKYILFLLVFGIIGGYFTAVYQLQMLDEATKATLTQQIGSIDLFIPIYVFQTVGYAVVLGIIGRFFAKKIGLWHSLNFNKKGIVSVIIVSIIGGCALILPDVLFFGNFSDSIRDSYLVKPTIEYLIASITYGGVIEEVMLRLFFMSGIAFLLKIFSKKESVTDGQLIMANIISALLFAAAHLPATIMTIGITPMIIFRCFLLNGGFGLVFGRLYRKRGIEYAMLAHAGCHIVSKLIWFIFI
jgi:membrane protease YdiL (CAAX protease family)